MPHIVEVNIPMNTNIGHLTLEVDMSAGFGRTIIECMNPPIDRLFIDPGGLVTLTYWDLRNGNDKKIVISNDLATQASQIWYKTRLGESASTTIVPGETYTMRNPSLTVRMG